MLDPKGFKAGDKVKWGHSQGTTTGHVVREQATPTKIEGHKVAASKDDAEDVVKSDKTGALAAHKTGELRKG